MTTATVSIKAAHLPVYTEAVEKLNKRARKNNVDGVSFSVSDVYTKPEPRLPSDHIFFDANDVS